MKRILFALLVSVALPEAAIAAVTNADLDRKEASCNSLAGRDDQVTCYDELQAMIDEKMGRKPPPKPTLASQERNESKRQVPGPSESVTSLESIRKINAQRERERKTRSLQRDIKKITSKIDRQIIIMNAELRLLEAKKNRSSNNLAGATRDVSISNEMTAVASKYNAIIENERANLERAERQLRDLR